jgi:hypothetical protein
MKRPIGGILGIVRWVSAGAVRLCGVDAGHEGVLVEQPFFFGHGGVDPVPSKTGGCGWRRLRMWWMWMSGRSNTRNISTSSRQRVPRSPDAFMIANSWKVVRRN